VVASLAALSGLVAGLEPDLPAMRRDAEATETTAVDLAEALVRDGVPFREAHTAVGAAVRLAATRGTRLADLDPADLAAIHPALAAADRSVLSVEGSLAAKATPGSTNPSRVGDQLAVLEVAASAARTWSSGFRPSLDLGLG
jgi:argininosuccinate lyase